MQLNWRRCTFSCGMLTALMACILTGFEEPEAPAKSTSERTAFIENMTKEFRIDTATSPPVSLVRGEKAILQWSWPRNGFTDGQTYVWGTQGRPQAIGGAFLVPAENAAYYEFVSLSSQPLICRWKDKTAWTPPGVDLSWQALSGAPKPAATPQARLTQLRSISRDIAGVARMGPPRYTEGSRWELRLLTTPLHRYADEGEGIVDGAVFVMAMGTDPQLIMLLEAQQEKGKVVWKTAFARLSGFEMAASIGDKEIWSSPKVEDGHKIDSVWYLSMPVDATKLLTPTTEKPE